MDILLNANFIINKSLFFLDSYNSARTKLKNAEMHTDISTDSEFRGKGKRRKRIVHRYGFTDTDTDTETVEDNNNSKRKTPKQTIYEEKIKLSIPKPPKDLMQSQCTSQKDATKLHFCPKNSQYRKTNKLHSLQNLMILRRKKIELILADHLLHL